MMFTDGNADFGHDDGFHTETVPTKESFQKKEPKKVEKTKDKEAFDVSNEDKKKSHPNKDGDEKAPDVSDDTVEKAKVVVDQVRTDMNKLLDRLLTGIQEFSTKARKVHETYLRVQESEHAETARLDEVEPNVINMSESFRAATAVAIMADRSNKKKKKSRHH